MDATSCPFEDTFNFFNCPPLSTKGHEIGTPFYSLVTVKQDAF